MKWATRPKIHVDRAACTWLISRYIDQHAVFVFVEDPLDVPADATPFDMRGAQLSHHQGRCTFEVALEQYSLTTDPALEEIGRIVHDADLADDLYDAPAAAGLDILIRGLTMTTETDQQTIAIGLALFDGLYEYLHQQFLTGRTPS